MRRFHRAPSPRAFLAVLLALVGMQASAPSAPAAFVPVDAEVHEPSAITSSPAPPCAQAPDGMQAWWRMDDATGSTVAASVFGGHDATRLGTRSIFHPSGGHVRGAIQFDGAGGNRLSAAHHPDLDFDATESFTIAAWVKDEGSVNGTIIDKRPQVFSSPLQGYFLSIRSSFHRYQLTIKHGGGQQAYHSPVNSVVSGQWQHVAVTVKAPAVPGGVREVQFYLDGAPVLTTSNCYTGCASLDDLSVDGPLTMGATAFDAGFLVGYLDEVQIFDRALDDADIAAIHAAGESGVCGPAPVVTSFTADVDPVNIADAVNASATYTDADDGDLHAATIDWGDGRVTGASVDQGANSVTGSHVYAEPGVYELSITVTDGEGNPGSAVYQFVVVYNPSGGFVAGGGLIQVPAGSMVALPDVAGGAWFGIYSRYRSGASVPLGGTRFRFRHNLLDFESTSYDWLVIAGAKAMYKGEGRVNGVPGYSFQVSAIDGSVNGGDGVDRFRIKIKDAQGGLVFDNQQGAGDNDDPTTAIQAGQVRIVKK